MAFNFPEMNPQTVAIERAVMMADDMAEQAQLDALHHEQDMERMRRVWDRSAALHEFILDQRTCPKDGYAI